ncbi:hypothetical protein [Kingella sp. (in: b-proteobacteria)]|uniref:hypothetical protein n=1 Tax=Kingella sp. (in: b-proteobacteria) TaxID=2020713 RepID=UPI0026DB19E6|nr:hypothetical protein [Kingella sp. (in: b-proteobacteria)]MDO4658600.1 hypothetical protein [Kingella sp. (in: b-proteobacteria)]
MKIVKTLITVAILAGAYHVYKSNNFTIIPPTDIEVKEAIRVVYPEMKDTRNNMLTITDPCKKIQGGMIDAVFSCKVEFYYRSNSQKTHVEDVRIIKRKGKWIVKQ